MQAPGPSGVSQPEWRLIRLRRDGLPPLRFEGILLAHHTETQPSAAPVETVWHELALYRVATGGYAAAIVVHFAAAALAPRIIACHAVLMSELNLTIDWFERHDAGQDGVPGLSLPDVTFDNPAVPPARLLLQAARLAAMQRDIIRRYRIGVGTFLLTLAGQVP